MTALAPPGSAYGLRHVLYPYDTADQYLAGTLAYIDQAHTYGAAVLIAVPEVRRDLLQSHLNGHSVAFLDTGALGRNPGRLIPAWQEWIAEHQRDGRTVHAVSESTWTGRSAAELSELRYHEWLLNRAFAQAPAWSLLCPYDTSDQPADSVQTLGRMHQWLWDGADCVPGTDYDPGPYPFEPYGEPCDPYEEIPYTGGDLAALRRKVAACAHAHQLPRQRLHDLQLAVTEIAANSIRYGGGSGTLRIWIQDGAMVCELRDTGVIADPLAGRIRPTPAQSGGRGLWFANQVCDLVEIRSNESEGTHIRLHVDLLHE
jgi:anti-sigma regulatory factor (Ser/Thr protein kinase)